MRISLRDGLIGVALAAMTLGSGCHNNGRQQKTVEERDTMQVTVIPDTAYYGHLGESTGMSTIQLVTWEGDTLVLNKTNEKNGDPCIILGEIANYTDTFAVTTLNDRESVGVMLNISQMLRTWTAGKKGKDGFTLEKDGYIRPLSANRYNYKEWTLSNCHLILVPETADTLGNTSDTLDIVELTPDSLVLRRAGATVTEVFYSKK